MNWEITIKSSRRRSDSTPARYNTFEVGAVDIEYAIQQARLIIRGLEVGSEHNLFRVVGARFVGDENAA